jgi:transposase
MGIEVGYSTVTRNLRELGLRCRKPKQEREAEAQEWLTGLIHGEPSLEVLERELKDVEHLVELIDYAKNGRRRERKKAVVVLARKRGIPNTVIARALHSSRRTTRQYFEIFCDKGLSVLFGPNRPRSEAQAGDPEKTRRILELLHHKPSYFGINRTSWTQKTLIDAYTTQYHENLSRRVLTRILTKADYRWKKARRVLTSPDPDYHEKVERLLRILRSLTEDEMFFFLDEWGPTQVKKRGGRAYRSKNDATTIPRKQKSKGTVTLVTALSATTNQLTWLFEPSKNTGAMINLLEILYNQHHTKSRLYITWDTVSWHGSIELTDWLDRFNDGSRKASTGPIIELVPLPTSAQFLNIIEGVLTAMTKAVIHNSDYQSDEEMKCAISRHFRERNTYFRDNPRRAGRRIWDPEFFSNHDPFRPGDCGE